jgi:hypothetical protein
VREHQLDDPWAEELHICVEPEEVWFGAKGVQEEFVAEAGDARAADDLCRGFVAGGAG